MNEALKNRLKQYACQSDQDYVNALKEIIQEIALLGLWRSKFFEKATFYGGTALRVLYQLDRFSEDMDFSLLKKEENFQLDKYNKAVETELQSFGLNAIVDKKIKNIDSNIQSAFIKTGTKQQLLMIEAPKSLVSRIHHQQLIKVKMEVDINPPSNFSTEAKILLHPIPFHVSAFKLPDAFAGKLHAVLCRDWQNRVKGRDWYDLIWFIGRSIPAHLGHLQERLIQTGHFDKNHILIKEKLLFLLKDKIMKVDFKQAKQDVAPFVKNRNILDAWSSEFFIEIIKKLDCE